MSADVVCTGDRLAAADGYIAGEGTYVRDGFIYASLVGHRRVRTDSAPSSAEAGTSTSGLPTLEVLRKEALAVLPKPGDMVTVKITRVQQLRADCTIMCVGTQALAQEFRGSIRVQDVRATEIDKVVMYDCFRPGDIVRAEVVSLGDARSYYLSTAKNELGVVYAKSAAAGSPMVAISWQEMQCPETQTVEKRKVAKVEAQPGSK